MADGENVNTEGQGGTITAGTEIVHRFVTEPVQGNEKPVGEDGFDEQKYLSLHERFKPQIEKVLGIDTIRTELQTEREARAADRLENAKLKAQTEYGFTAEELAEIPGDDAESFGKAAAVAGKYRRELAQTIQAVQDSPYGGRGILPSEAAVNAAYEPKEGTPEWHIRQLQKAQGVKF